MTNTIIIRHTNTDGTVIEGTVRGDGSQQILKAHALKWSRRLAVWYLQGSRGRAPKRHRIDAIAESLKGAGFQTQVEVEQYKPEEAFGALQNAGTARADALAARAEAKSASASDSFQASRDAIAGIPAGQPILVGHHSERRHRKDLDRSDRHGQRSLQAHTEAQSAARRSEAAASRARRRENPVVMARRMKRLQAAQRDLERRLPREPGLQARLTDVTSEIGFLDEAIAASGVKRYAPSDLKAGDRVTIHGRQRIVAKVNPKTVAVDTGYSWTDKYPFYEITGHEPVCTS